MLSTITLSIIFDKLRKRAEEKRREGRGGARGVCCCCCLSSVGAHKQRICCCVCAGFPSPLLEERKDGGMFFFSAALSLSSISLRALSFSFLLVYVCVHRRHHLGKGQRGERECQMYAVVSLTPSFCPYTCPPLIFSITFACARDRLGQLTPPIVPFVVLPSPSFSRSSRYFLMFCSASL